jgi:hypothetical protein
VRALGVDEHIWRPSHHGAERAVTAMVDLTRDEHGFLHAAAAGRGARSGTAYAAWLTDQPEGFAAGVEHAALDPFRGYASAIRDELPDAVAVLDAFHVVRLGAQVVDEVRRRVQQDTWATAVTRTTRSIGFAACCGTAASTSPTANAGACRQGWTPATPAARSPSPGRPTNGCGPSTTPRVPQPGASWRST